MHKKYKKAFSLVELSIVILIVSILITGSLGISKTAINNAKTKITKERMAEIYDALANFVANKRRLPCPALLTVAKGTETYGDEASTPGTCDNTYISNVTNSDNLAYGMIPIKALGIDIDMAEDGWGNKFSYVVDKRFTLRSDDADDTDGFEITKSIVAEDGVAISPTLPALIDIQGPSETSLLPDENALFVIISHGANKYSGFNATGTSQSTTDGVTDELSNNCNGGSTSTTCIDTAAARYDNVFIAYSNNSDFDDILLYKTKPQLVRDAGMEFMICNADEAKTSTLSWTKNADYGCNACSSTANNQKTCGKYGTWGNTLTNTCTVNKVTCTSSSSGKILQIQYAIKTDVFILSTEDVWTDWTDMSVDITPADSNSKFKISFSSSVSNTSSNSFQYVKLVRVVGGTPTDIAIGDTASSAQRSWVDGAFGDINAYNTTQKPLSGIYIDDPSTADVVTYKLQVRKTLGGDSYYGRTASINDDNRSSTPSVLIIEEIAG